MPSGPLSTGTRPPRSPASSHRTTICMREIAGGPRPLALSFRPSQQEAFRHAACEGAHALELRSTPHGSREDAMNHRRIFALALMLLLLGSSAALAPPSSAADRAGSSVHVGYASAFALCRSLQSSFRQVQQAQESWTRPGRYPPRISTAAPSPISRPIASTTEPAAHHVRDRPFCRYRRRHLARFPTRRQAPN